MNCSPCPKSPRLKIAAHAILATAAASSLCLADGILETGGGTSLASGSQSLSPASGSGAPFFRLEFEFGFTSDDRLQPSSFADSFTVSLENPLGQRMYLLSSDAAGTLWAPFVPGAIPVAGSDLEIHSVAFHAGIPTRTLTYAYRIDVAVPPEWQHQPLVLRYDLFDNRDDRQTTAYVGGAALVPEPEISLLAAATLAIVAAGLARRRFRTDSRNPAT